MIHLFEDQACTLRVQIITARSLRAFAILGSIIRLFLLLDFCSVAYRED